MNRPVLRLTIIAFVGLAILLTLQFLHAKTSNAENWTLAQRIAMERVIEAQRLLFETRSREVSDEENAELATTDITKSGLVGIEWSHLVSTQGTLEAKIASTDPRWAALFVAWFERAGAGPDRPVAIGSSASFPALLLSARIAAEVLGAEPLIAGSLTSSNYGATLPSFDLWRMEEILLRNKMVDAPLLLLSPGGDNDRLDGFEDQDKIKILARLNKISTLSKTVGIIYPEDTEQSVYLRDQALLINNVAVFVNIGGHAANFGTGISALAVPHGYTEPNLTDRTEPHSSSVIDRALERDIPVINIINIRSIMLKEGLGNELSDEHVTEASIVDPYSWPKRLVSIIVAFFLMGSLTIWRYKPTKWYFREH